MPENFITPVGLSSDSGTWNFTINQDGNLEIRSNSPTGGGETRVLLNDDTGQVGIGTSDNPTTLNITGEAIARDTNGTDRVHLSSTNQRIEIRNASGDIISMIGDNANLRLGTNGQDGDILLYPSSASDIFNNGQASIWMDANSGDIKLSGGDCAELFDVANECDIEAGTVLVLDESADLCPCKHHYDKRVAGVISGAGDFRPGMILDHQRIDGVPVALMGKVWCKVDASEIPIEVGDLLTTSPTPGHAMKAEDRDLSFGSVLGKAMGSLDTGKGLIPILVTLQ